MSFNAQNCPQCGAPLPVNTTRCTYCASWLAESTTDIGRGRFVVLQSLIKMPPGIGEFGTSQKLPIWISFILALTLYLCGWIFEDKIYWLDTKAMTLWIGALPLILYLTALYWKTHRHTLFASLMGSISLFSTHLFIIWVIRGSIWDDHVGIAAIVSGINLTSWVLGRFTHATVRFRRIQP